MNDVACSVLSRQLRLFVGGDFLINHFAAADQRKMGHVSGVHPLKIQDFRMKATCRCCKADEVLIKPMLLRQEFRMVAEMPFAKPCGRVALLTAHFRKSHLVAVDTDFRCGPNAPRIPTRTL